MIHKYVYLKKTKCFYALSESSRNYKSKTIVTEKVSEEKASKLEVDKRRTIL